MKIVLSNYKNKYLHDEKLNGGVIGIKIHSAYGSSFVEIWTIDHVIDFLNGTPVYFTFVEDIPVFIFSNNQDYFNYPSISLEKIEQLIKNHGVSQMDTPPNTGFCPTILYHYGNPVDSIFSVVDTLFKYDDKEKLYQAIYKYVGEIVYY